MIEENISQEFRLKNIYQTKNYLIEEINRNDLMSKKLQKFCVTLNHIAYLLILSSTITGCISISAFASLAGIPIGITSSAIGLKICAITEAIKNYKSIIKKKKKKNDKIVLVAKSKLNSIEVLFLVISLDEFVSINNVIKEHNKTKEEIKNLKT